jgi:uncharacterized protein (TIGR03032 family)
VGPLGDDVLIVSDPSDETPGGIYVYDGTSTEVIDRVSTAGLALAPDGRLLRVPRSFDEPKSSGELLVYDSRGVRNYHRVDHIVDGHGVAWHNGSYVLASTATNTIVWLDESGRKTAHWQPEGNGDAWHLNDLCSHRDTLYAAAFGRGGKHREWVTHMAGTGVVLDISDGTTVVTGLSAPHSPRLIDGGWVVCNSGTRELLVFEQSGRTVERRVQLRTWPRGLAMSGRMMFVGESEHRFENDDPSARATIAIVDTDDWNVVDRVEVPGREIYDLVLVPRTLAEGVAIGFGSNTFRSRTVGQLGLFEAVGIQPTRFGAIGEPLPAHDRQVRIEAQIPEQLPAHATIDLELVLENLGSSILVTAPPNPVYLSYHWYLDGERSHIVEAPLMSPLPHAVSPRTPTSCCVRVRTHAAGCYRLRLTLAQEYVGWFDEIDAGSIFEATVEVVAAPTIPRTSEPPLSDGALLDPAPLRNRKSRAAA